MSKPIADKELRTKAHQSVRRIFQSRLETSTNADGSITVSAASPASRGARQQRPKPSRAWGKQGWDDLGGQYVHFTLYKENKDTMEVVSYIASQLRTAPKSFQYAGTKDRRAVTVQRMSAYRIDAATLAARTSNIRNALIGDFQHCRTGLELGQLRGNEFVITLRDCHFQGEAGLSHVARLELARSTVQKAVADFRRNGFINYYGLQRFGTFGTGTDTVGVKMLQGDLKGAVAAILDFSPDALAAALDPTSTTNTTVGSDDRARAHALHIFQSTSDAPAALALLPRKFSAETNLIRHLGHADRRSGLQPHRHDYQGALHTIPRNLRLMYVHAYQSRVWNAAAGQRWALYGSRVVPGDLVLVHEHEDKDPARGVDAAATVDEQGEPIVLPAPTDSAVDSASAFVRARALSKEEAESGGYGILDVVLPLPGFDVEYPPNEVGEFYREFMGGESGGGLDPADMRRAWKDVSLSGSYRKVLALPGEELSAEVRAYSRDEAQLVETDLNRLRGEKVVVDEDEEGDGDGDTKMGEDGVQGNEKGQRKLAVILKMQLGPSQYATMALRELMKAGGVKTYQPDFAGR